MCLFLFQNTFNYHKTKENIHIYLFIVKNFELFSVIFSFTYTHIVKTNSLLFKTYFSINLIHWWISFFFLIRTFSYKLKKLNVTYCHRIGKILYCQLNFIVFWIFLIHLLLFFCFFNNNLIYKSFYTNAIDHIKI